ncbi:hypothetical protein SAMN06298226_2104 [Nitrosovibrio sp. Nv4]|nr:hypothetical protein SAMN06298226_2104 [Nitrosovibrio sp. Nv4]
MPNRATHLFRECCKQPIEQTAEMFYSMESMLQVILVIVKEKLVMTARAGFDANEGNALARGSVGAL